MVGMVFGGLNVWTCGVVVFVGADPGHQAIPSGWPTTLDGLNTQVFT